MDFLGSILRGSSNDHVHESPGVRDVVRRKPFGLRAILGFPLLISLPLVGGARVVEAAVKPGW